jgi:hypothetical protein
MQYDIKVPENKVPLKPSAGWRLPQAGNSADISIYDWLAAVHNRLVAGYPNNRGGGKVAVPTVKECRDRLDLDALGCLTVAGDILADGHSRTMGLHLRWCLGLMTPQELAATVTVKTVPSDRLVGIYGRLNSGKAHTAGDKLANTDLGLGRLVHSQVLCRLSPQRSGVA